MARIAVIGTGGTFAMEGRHAFDWVEYGESGVVHPVGALIGQARALLPVEIAIETADFRALGSTAITPADWIELAARIRTVEGVDGIVVTHGTATLEETAFFLDCVHDSPVPVVLTGAQRPSNTMGSDAMANLRAAILVAASQAAREQGVLVVVDNEVFAARDVTKTSSHALDAFEAPGSGPLGRVEPHGAVVLRRRVVRSPWASRFSPVITDGRPLPRVDIALSYAGVDGTTIDALVAAGSRAIVSAGLVPGRPAGGEHAALRAAAARGVVVVQSTRGTRGNVVSQDFLARDGMLAGGDLSPHKLRIVLMLALALTEDIPTIQQWILEG